MTESAGGSIARRGERSHRLDVDGAPRTDHPRAGNPLYGPASRLHYRGGHLLQGVGLDDRERFSEEGDYRAIGSIEARIEALFAHDTPYSCTAWTLLTNEPVRCFFSEPELLAAAYRNFQRRVTLRGILTSRVDGEVASMRVHSIEPFPSDDELPTVDDIRGMLANGA